MPSARLVGVAGLKGYALRFHKRSRDGSGKADAYQTSDTDDLVLGVVYEIDERQKPDLDKAEGLGQGYTEKPVEVLTLDGRTLEVRMYFAELDYVSPVLRPYSWYKRFVLEGARQHTLPQRYIDVIKAVPEIEDADKRRVNKASLIACRSPRDSPEGESMSIRQTRVFVPNTEVYEATWVETLLGRVVRPLVDGHPELVWFWFSRYAVPRGKDDGDCAIDEVPASFEVRVNGERRLRSIRFRFSLPESKRQAFEDMGQKMAEAEGCMITDWRNWDQVEDLGGDRFVGEVRDEARRIERADLVTSLCHNISRLVLHSLVGPDPRGRYRQEINDHNQNLPLGSTFESINHLCRNIAGLPG